MHPLISLLLLIILWPILMFLYNLWSHKSFINEQTDKEVKKITEYANTISNIISEKININNNTLLYEEFFLFYFLHVIRAVDFRQDDEICFKVQKKLFSSLEQFNDLGFTIEQTFEQRKTDYSKIYEKHDLKYNNKFLYDIFNYQAEHLTNTSDDKQTILSVLSDNINIFLHFYNNTNY